MQTGVGARQAADDAGRRADESPWMGRGGLDVALRKLLQEPFGGPMLALVAIGFAGYGVFCFARARHLDR